MAAGQPEVTLPAGTISGGYCADTGVKLFQGIPYAKPPVKELRFMPPQPLEGGFPGGRLNATTPPSACIQFDDSGSGAPPSEDCLYLDVYVPAAPNGNGKPWPVKVYSYGGANVFGDLAYGMYDACHLATDAVVVTFNYRLGPLGFLGLAAAGIRGNMALQDHVAALEWVRAGIAAFGGDPRAVVLFGQSAGADNAFVVSALPRAPALLDGAVLQSGGGSEVLTLEEAQRIAASYVGVLGCATNDLKCLQGKSAQELVEAYPKTPVFQKNSLLRQLYGVQWPNTTSIALAIVDGEFIKEQPLETGALVPILAGSTEGESSFFIYPYYQAIGAADKLTEQNYTDYVSLWGPFAGAIRERYPFSHFATPEWTESEAVLRGMYHLSTVVAFTCPAQKALEAARRNGVPAYAYRFGLRPTCPWIQVGDVAVPGPDSRRLSGPMHTAEVPFVFANMDRQPFGRGTCNYTAREKSVSRMMVRAWTSMAQKGSPSSCAQEWPGYDVCERQGVYVGDDGTPVERIDFDECDFWNPIWEQIGGYKMPAKNC
ncbi:hypothetical protein V2A60_006770 [Cordyceps javanica]